MRRRRCLAPECLTRPGYHFDINLGEPRRPAVVYVCEDHLRKAMVAAFWYQQERGDTYVSLLVTPLERPRRPPGRGPRRVPLRAR